ncbi:MAG: hypothetical protein AAFO04_02040 [Cyanobacteria bacterium J06592_8]
MQLKVKSGVGMALSILSAITASVTLFSQASLAQQNTTINPLGDFNSQSNDKGTSLGIDQSTMYQLIHRAQMGTLDLDVNAVYDQQQDNIQDAAAEFRAKQRQRIQQGTPEVAPEGFSSDEALNPSN